MTQATLPHWARKPNHKKEVIATPLGWMVKETGEYLKLVKNLDVRLQQLKADLQKSIDSIDTIETKVTEETPKANIDETAVQPVVNVEPEQEQSTTSPEAELTPETTVDEPVVKPKRRGRPAKKK